MHCIEFIVVMRCVIEHLVLQAERLQILFGGFSPLAISGFEMIA